jgi:hypothetical protein
MYSRLQCKYVLICFARDTEICTLTYMLCAAVPAFTAICARHSDKKLVRHPDYVSYISACMCSDYHGHGTHTASTAAGNWAVHVPPTKYGPQWSARLSGAAPR